MAPALAPTSPPTADVPPPLVLELHDALRYRFGDRDRGLRDPVALLLVQVSGVRTLERPPAGEGHDTVLDLEEAVVHLTVTGREAADQHDAGHLVRPGIGRHPGERASGRVSDDHHAASHVCDSRDDQARVNVPRRSAS